MYIQLGFYDADDAHEIAFFATKFGTFSAFPIATIIASMLLCGLAVNTRCYLLYEKAVWLSMFTLSAVCSIPCLAAYPWMDPVLRNMRESAARARLSRQGTAAAVF